MHLTEHTKVVSTPRPGRTLLSSSIGIASVAVHTRDLPRVTAIARRNACTAGR
jgi:hypothetical protein